MWRFINSIPRVFRHHLHGPRASYGVHVEEERVEQDIAEKLYREKETCIPCVETCLREETVEWQQGQWCCENQDRVLFFGKWLLQRLQSSNSNGSSSGSSQKHVWESCKHSFWSFIQGSNNVLEALTVGSAFVWGSDGSKNKNNWKTRHLYRKTRLLYRVLFAAPGQVGITQFNNDSESSPVLQNDVYAGRSLMAIKDAAGAAHDAAINSIQKPESLDSVMKDFQKMCTQYTAQSESLLGLEAAQKGKMSEAVEHLHSSCSCGNMSACFNLGLCYETGSGVQQSYEKAEHYYRIASEGGHNLASYNLGLMYLNKEGYNEDPQADVEQGIKLLEKAARLGVAEAQMYLGMYNMEDTGDTAKAVLYFKSAAGQNDREAQYLLGVCYEQGLGVEVNECRAAQLYSMAASSGHAAAMYNLAVFNERGLGGIPEDRLCALDLYNRAASLGSEHAQNRLEEIRAIDNWDTVEVKKSQEYSLATDSTADIPLTSLSEKKSKCVISPSASSPNFTGFIDDLSPVCPWYFSDTKPKEVLTKENCEKVSVNEQKVPVHFYIGDSDAENEILLEKNDRAFEVKKLYRPIHYGLKNLQHNDFPSETPLHLHHSHTSPSLSLVSCNN